MTTRRKKSAPRPAQTAKAAPSESEQAAFAAGTAEGMEPVDRALSPSPVSEAAESPQAASHAADGVGVAPETAQEPAPVVPETSSPACPGPCAAEDAAREEPEAELPPTAPDGNVEAAAASFAKSTGDASRPGIPTDASGEAEKAPCGEGATGPSESGEGDACRAAGPACRGGSLPEDEALGGEREETAPDAGTPEAGPDAPGGDAACEDASLAVMEDSLRHGRRVAVIAATLFQDLMDLHGLSDEWGHRLHHAALLHDIGFVEGKKGHHKASMRLIEENAGLNLSDEERPFVALLARYHRKAWPSRRHARFAALKKRDQEALRKAAAILRIADALDYAHAGAVGSLAVTVRKRRIILAVQCRCDCSAEVRRVAEKSDLFRHVFGRKVECLSLRD